MNIAGVEARPQSRTLAPRLAIALTAVSFNEVPESLESWPIEIVRLFAGRPLFLIDLAVPRDIDPAINQLDGAYLYDIDSLQFIAQRGLERRKREITQCEHLIAHHAAEFYQWLHPSS